MHLATGLFLAVAIFLIAGTEAAHYKGKFEDPAHPGKCVVDGLVLDQGQTGRHPKVCGRVGCGKNSQADVTTCGTVGSLPPGYKFKEPAPNAEYPACCKTDIEKE